MDVNNERNKTMKEYNVNNTRVLIDNHHNVYLGEKGCFEFVSAEQREAFRNFLSWFNITPYHVAVPDPEYGVERYESYVDTDEAKYAVSITILPHSVNEVYIISECDKHYKGEAKEQESFIYSTGAFLVKNDYTEAYLKSIAWGTMLEAGVTDGLAHNREEAQRLADECGANFTKI